MTEIIDHLIKR